MHCVVSFLLSCILRDFSFTEVGSVCRVAFREPMHLFTCVSEEGDNGEDPSPETPSLLSYTLRYISFGEVGSVCRVAFREPMHLCTCVSEEGDNGETPIPETPSVLSYILRYISFAEVGNICRVAFRPFHDGVTDMPVYFPFQTPVVTTQGGLLCDSSSRSDDHNTVHGHVLIRVVSRLIRISVFPGFGGV
jgi:hypothetical protein